MSIDQYEDNKDKNGYEENTQTSDKSESKGGQASHTKNENEMDDIDLDENDV